MFFRQTIIIFKLTDITAVSVVAWPGACFVNVSLLFSPRSFIIPDSGVFLPNLQFQNKYWDDGVNSEEPLALFLLVKWYDASVRLQFIVATPQQWSGDIKLSCGTFFRQKIKCQQVLRSCLVWTPWSPGPRNCSERSSGARRRWAARRPGVLTSSVTRHYGFRLRRSDELDMLLSVLRKAREIYFWAFNMKKDHIWMTQMDKQIDRYSLDGAKIQEI